MSEMCDVFDPRGGFLGFWFFLVCWAGFWGFLLWPRRIRGLPPSRWGAPLGMGDEGGEEKTVWGIERVAVLFTRVEVERSTG